MHIRHLSRVLGTRSSRKTLGVYLSTFFVIEAHRDIEYLIQYVELLIYIEYLIQYVELLSI